MTDESDTNARAEGEAEDSRHAPPEPPGGTRALILLEAGGRLLALPAEALEATAEDLRPTPLPFAPPAVLGVVSLRGRVRTVLDAGALLPPEGAPTDAGEDGPPRVFVALHGDEQLALAARRVLRAEVSPEAFEPPPADAPALVVAAFIRDGRQVFLLEPARLFDAALSGAERRRKR